ncbi:MAG: BspA family leucine-rich repeat surface protein [Clostridiales bacterium]|nr:BspA family leucine-rich repeat surface protein [Clostridiales bacterium]
MPSYDGAEPSKASTAEYTYTFAGWTPELVEVTANATYTAKYTETKNKYEITWKNYDGSELKTDTVEYGATPSYDGETPTKPADAEYTYTFAGWEPTVVSVTGNAEYTATYTKTPIAAETYTITWLDADGTELEKDEGVAKGTMPSYDGAEPSKDATAEYTYTFAGWTPELVEVTANATYTAKYTETKNKYTVTWKNYDGSELKTDTVEYGVTPSYDGETPTRQADAEYTYTFAGWEPTVVSVTTDAEYTATYTKTPIATGTYIVTFDANGGTVDPTSKEVTYDSTYGELPTPTKEKTYKVTYNYNGGSGEPVSHQPKISSTFNGWYLDETNDNGNGTRVTSESTVTTESNHYLYAKWTDYELSPITLPTPTRDGYKFAGWYDGSTHVGNGGESYKPTTEDVTLTAKWIKTYTITWLDEDETVLEKDENVAEGDMPTYDGQTPTKESDAEYTYTFAGWEPTVVAVTGNATYTATYTKIPFDGEKCNVCGEYNCYHLTTTLKEGSGWYEGSVDKNTIKNTITSIEFTEAYTRTGNETERWTVDTEGTINCYRTGTELVIVGNGTGRIKANANSSQMFDGFTALETIENLALLDTSNVTDMTRMFDGCESLTELDLSSFSTSNVTSMVNMFIGCDNLGEITFGDDFKTDSVEYIGGMFSECSSLTSLNLSNFNTSSVKSMANMFNGCSALTTLDVSKWNTSNVTNMLDMFNDCKALTTLDVSNFDTSKVEIMAHMFMSCKSLEELDVSRWETENVTNMNNMFTGCEKLVELDLSSFTALEIDAGWMLSGLTNLKRLILGSNLKLNETMKEAFGDQLIWYKLDGTPVNDPASVDRTEVTIYTREVVPTFRAGNEWLDGHSEVYNTVTSIMIQDSPKEGLEVAWTADEAGRLSVQFDKGGAIMIISGNGTGIIRLNPYSGYMFSGFTKLSSINGLELLNADSVTSMMKMFSGCTNLYSNIDTTLDLSSLNTANVIDMSYMFENCGVREVDLRGNFDTASVTDMSYMFSGCSNLQTIYGINDLNLESLMDVEGMFMNCTSLGEDYEIFSLLNWDVSELENANYMFKGCTSLYWAELLNWNAPKLVEAKEMFKGCTALEYVNIIGWEANSLADITSMFENCTILDFVVLKNTDISSLSKTTSMFKGCEALEYVDLSSIDSFVLSNAASMFEGCSSLVGSATVKGNSYVYGESLVLPIVGKLTDVSNMFKGCANLKEIDLSSCNGYKLENTASMFEGCSKLEKVALPNDFGCNLTDMSKMFYGCSSLTDLDLTVMNGSSTASKLTTTESMFEGCENIKVIDFGTFFIDYDGVLSNLSNMFKGCESLEELYITGFNTRSATSMSNIFDGCSNLSIIALGEYFAFINPYDTTAYLPVPTGNTEDVAWYDELGNDYSITEIAIRHGVSEGVNVTYYAVDPTL